MGAMDAFETAWWRSRATFGEGQPVTGARFDRSDTLERLRDATAAAGTDAWRGSASEAYATKTSRQSNELGTLGDLDKRLGAEVDRSASITSAGRRDMETVRQWVSDAAATTSSDVAGQRALWSIVSRGSDSMQKVISTSHDDASTVAGRIRALASEYGMLGDGDGISEFDDPEKRDAQPPPTTLDIADVLQLGPRNGRDQSTRPPPGFIELVPGSGTYVPNPRSRFYQPTPVKAPLDLADIEVFDPKVRKIPGRIELIPGAGVWVPDPNYPGYAPKEHDPPAPVDLTKIRFVDPGPMVPPGTVELWPHAGIVMPDPYAGRPF